jgi:2-enoate reductase
LKLFEEGKIGRVLIKNRLVMAPMGTGFVEPDGRIQEREIQYLTERAKGGVGLIITGCVKVENAIEKTSSRIMHPIAAARFDELVAAVHDYRVKIAIQLTAGFGRVVETEGGSIAPSPVRCFWNPNVTARALKTEEVEAIVKAFGDAAQIVNSAEFDAVELHGHEGYLLDQFKTSLWNRRTDKYGGDLDGRLNFPLEIIKTLKDKLGRDFPIIYRYGAKHYLEGGRDVEESSEIGKRFEKAGIDALHIDAGCYETWYWAHPPTYQAHGCLVNMAEAVKKAVKVPVIAVGRLDIPELAEKVLQDGKADFIALGRGLIADSEWPVKAREGRSKDICPCIGDHEGCLKRVNENKYVSCTVNPVAGNEKEFKITKAERIKSVLVAGGGVAGMEAALVSALRGHKVVLYEKKDELGGHLVAASVPSFKQDLRRLIDYLANQVRRLDVTVRFKQEVTAELLKEVDPEVAIIAAGSTSVIPKVPGIENDIVTTAENFLLSKKEIGNHIIVAGGGLVGCETALHIAEKGKAVTVVEMLPDIATDLFQANRQQLLQMLNKEHVSVRTNTRLVEITDEEVLVQGKEGLERLEADEVILALGLKPETTLLQELKGKVPEIYAVGDCVEPRKIMPAIHEAFRTARLI